MGAQGKATEAGQSGFQRPTAGEEVRAFTEHMRRQDLVLIANAALSGGAEPTPAQQQHAAMARRILAIEADREQEGR